MLDISIDLDALKEHTPAIFATALGSNAIYRTTSGYWRYISLLLFWFTSNGIAKMIPANSGWVSALSITVPYTALGILQQTAGTFVGIWFKLTSPRSSQILEHLHHFEQLARDGTAPIEGQQYYENLACLHPITELIGKEGFDTLNILINMDSTVEINGKLYYDPVRVHIPQVVG